MPRSATTRFLTSRSKRPTSVCRGRSAPPMRGCRSAPAPRLPPRSHPRGPRPTAPRRRPTPFDPLLYAPRPQVVNGVPVGPPTGGFVQAGNVTAPYDLTTVPNVDKRVVNTIDPNNVAPRLGLAYAPAGRSFSVRAGY